MAPARSRRCTRGAKRANVLAERYESIPGGIPMTRTLRAALIIATALLCAPAHAADKWITSWVASVQGPYPVGNPSAQPVLKFAFPTAEAGARDQTFRLILLPEIWGKQTRLRFSNAFGTKPVTFDGVHVGLQY